VTAVAHRRPEFRGQAGMRGVPTWSVDPERIDLASDPWRPSDPTAQAVLRDTADLLRAEPADWSEVEDWEDAMPCRPALRPVAGEWEPYGTEPTAEELAWAEGFSALMAEAAATLPLPKPKTDPGAARRREVAATKRRRKRERQRTTAERVEAIRPALEARMERAVAELPAKLAAVPDPVTRRWSGLANQWAQMCWACGELVPVGAGTFRAIAPGEWEASHWACR
jgi:hypothetical protein